MQRGDALGEGVLLKPQTQQARVAGQPLEKGPEYDVYGQGIGTLEGWVGHTGEGFGHTVLVMHNPESGATVASRDERLQSGQACPHAVLPQDRAGTGQGAAGALIGLVRPRRPA